jgi:hypothetical protein
MGDGQYSRIVQIQNKMPVVFSSRRRKLRGRRRQASRYFQIEMSFD